ncbi:MAG TPA: glycerophosphodiester phosphodiesterase family protein [Gemmatimonadaceae bacterium]|nr:glycerophosphodiester phosphodiesterase family protein [Gemmatimonadaceae bacterium]
MPRRNPPFTKYDVLLSPAERPVIAHRGASAYAPENTLEAFELALSMGADALELDVRVTADGVPVVVHDATLDRTTDMSAPVAERAFEQLRRADAGACFSTDGVEFPWRGRGVRVPALAEVLDALPDVPLLIEVKEPRGQEEVRRVLTDQRAMGRCVVAAERVDSLRVFREPPWVCGATRPDIASLYFGTLIGLRRPPRRTSYSLIAAPARWLGLRVPNARFNRAARRLSTPVHVWTVDDPAEARRLWRDGASGMVTNRPDVMVKARG